MADDLFVLREDIFDPATTPDDIDVSEAETRYAALVAEVIWDGVITPEKRQRLTTATKTFGLGPARARQIERALTAAHEARHRTAVVEQRLDPPASRGSTAAAPEPDAASEPSFEIRAPLAPAADPGIRTLQRRIALLEAQNDALQAQSADMDEHNEQLENLVDQLQYALESTLDELGEVRDELQALKRTVQPVTSELVPATVRDDAPPTTRDSTPASPPQATQPEGVPPTAPTETSATSASEPPPEEEAPATTRSGIPPPPVEPHAVAEAAMALAGLTAAGTPPQFGGTPVLGTTRLDPARILSALERAPKRDYTDVWGKAAPRTRGDPEQVHRLLVQRPRDAELLHSLFQSLQRAEDYDRRWCIAQALAYLGEADEEERALYQRHVSAGLVKPVRAVNEDEWHELLFHPDEDQLTGQILAAIAPAVLLGHMPAIRASIVTEHLPADNGIDPACSTLQSARCFHWAASVLGLQCPPLYLAPDLPGTAEVVLDPVPKTRLNKHLLAGRTTAELAFVAGYHLTWYRREHLLGKPTRSVRRAEDMFLAALLIGNPGLPITPAIKERVEPIAQTIRPLLGPAELERLRSCFARFIEEGGRTSLRLWLDAVENTAVCAGLLLANDLNAADAMLRIEEDETTADRHLGVLIAYAAGSRYSRLRKRIGIAVKPMEDW